LLRCLAAHAGAGAGGDDKGGNLFQLFRSS
jgi:hypothetical protein